MVPPRGVGQSAGQGRPCDQDHPHGLRHAHASWLLAGGADIQVVKGRLGHGSIRTTELYLRSLPGSRDTGLDALIATWGARRSAHTQRPKPEPTPVTTADFRVDARGH
ncbi:MAG: tyrosine-type recombinase/integrase [Mycobacteriaceae bacterium]